MTALVLRVALASSWRGDRRDRRRAGALAVAAAVVAALVCGAASAWLLSTRVVDRAEERSFAAADPRQAPAAERSALYDETSDGRQVFVYWWRIDDPAFRLPGADVRPAVGSWWVSPALAHEMRQDPELARRYPRARTLQPAGVAFRDELLAHRIVGPDVELDEALAATRGPVGIADGSEQLELYPIVVAGLALLGLPGLGLLVAASSPLLVSVERRQRLLRALGAPGGVQRAVLVVQAAVCALPGALVGALTWWAGAPRLDTFPVVGRPVFEGDLAVPLLWAMLAAAVSTALAVACLAARPRRLGGVRPTVARPRRPGLGRAAPLLAGLSLTAYAATVGGEAGARLFLAGVLAATLGAAAALPVLVDLVGSTLVRRPGLLALLVGRRLRWGAVTGTRSLLALGTVATVLPVVAAWVAVARAEDPVLPRVSGGIEVRGSLPPTEVERLASASGSVPLAVAVRQTGEAPPVVELVGDCDRLSRVLAEVTCDRGEIAVPAAALGLRLGPEPVLRGRPTAPPGSSIESTVFVTDDLPGADAVLRAAVINGERTGLQVITPGRRWSHESPLVQWILGATAVAGGVGSLALGLHLAGQAAEVATSRLRLVALGIDRAVLRRLASTEASLVVLVAGAGCAAVGAVLSWLFVQRDAAASVPVGAVALVLTGVVAVAALAGAAAGLTVTTGDAD